MAPSYVWFCGVEPTWRFFDAPLDEEKCYFSTTITRAALAALNVTVYADLPKCECATSPPLPPSLPPSPSWPSSSNLSLSNATTAVAAASSIVRDSFFWNFGIGFLFVDDWLDDGRDIVVRFGFHHMTVEDVVLVIVTILPACFGLAEVLRQLCCSGPPATEPE